MNPAFLKYKLYFPFLKTAVSPPVGSAPCFQKYLQFTEIQTDQNFTEGNVYSCKHLTIFYINYRLHLQTSPEDMTTKSFKTTFSQTGACISLGSILKEAQCSSAQKTLHINQCRREDTSITDPCAVLKARH